jgi:uncharacterized protein (DUF433 family)
MELPPDFDYGVKKFIFSKIRHPMKHLTRISFDPNVMGGKPCIRGMRVTVGMVVGLVASGYAWEEILEAFPYLEEEDIKEALAYAAWRAEEMEIPFAA